MAKKGVKAKKAASVKSSKIPRGVKTISILYYIIAALSVILGLMLFAAVLTGGPLLIDLYDLDQSQAIAAGAVTGILAVASVIIILIGVLYFFTARGLWGLRNWARILGAVIAVVGFANGIATLVVNVVGIGLVKAVFWGVIGYYLLFNRTVKKAFKG